MSLNAFCSAPCRWFTLRACWYIFSRARSVATVKPRLPNMRFVLLPHYEHGMSRAAGAARPDENICPDSVCT